MKNKLVKAIKTRSYSVDLYDTPEGFVVQSEVFGGLQQHTQPITDLKTALIAFDNKVQELEGN